MFQYFYHFKNWRVQTHLDVNIRKGNLNFWSISYHIHLLTKCLQSIQKEKKISLAVPIISEETVYIWEWLIWQV